MEKNKKGLSHNVVYCLFMFAITSLVIGATIFTNKTVDDIVLASIDYKEKGMNPTYRVFYKENPFYTDAFIEEGKTYISSYVDKIEVDYNYLVDYSKKLSGSYDYFVNARLVAYTPGEESEELWTKDYKLTDVETIDFNNDNSYQINKTVSIDYGIYKSEYERYRANSPVVTSAKLIVEIIINNHANYIGLDEFGFNASLAVEIPLGDETFKITTINNVIGENITIKSVDSNESEKMLVRVITILLWVLAVFISVCFIIVYHYNLEKLSYYEYKLNRILNNYDSIIVNVEKLPVLNNYNVVNVISFEELLDAQSEVRLPINFKEDKKRHSAKFVLVKDSMAWVYSMKEEDIDY